MYKVKELSFVFNKQLPKSLISIWKKIADPIHFENSKIERNENKIIIKTNNNTILSHLKLCDKLYLNAIKLEIPEIEEISVTYSKTLKINTTQNIKEKKEQNNNEEIKKIFKKNEEYYKNVEDEFCKNLFIASKSLKEINKLKLSEKCKNCDEKKEENNELCIICYNEKINKQISYVKKRILEEIEYKENYATKVNGIEKKAYEIAKDEALSELFLLFLNKFKEKKHFEEELVNYIKVLYETENEYIINLEKNKILEKLRKREENEETKRKY